MSYNNTFNLFPYAFSKSGVVRSMELMEHHTKKCTSDFSFGTTPPHKPHPFMCGGSQLSHHYRGKVGDQSVSTTLVEVELVKHKSSIIKRSKSQQHLLINTFKHIGSMMKYLTLWVCNLLFVWDYNIMILSPNVFTFSSNYWQILKHATNKLTPWWFFKA